MSTARASLLVSILAALVLPGCGATVTTVKELDPEDATHLSREVRSVKLRVLCSFGTVKGTFDDEAEMLVAMLHAKGYKVERVGVPLGGSENGPVDGTADCAARRDTIGPGEALLVAFVGYEQQYHTDQKPEEKAPAEKSPDEKTGPEKSPDEKSLEDPSAKGDPVDPFATRQRREVPERSYKTFAKVWLYKYDDPGLVYQAEAVEEAEGTDFEGVLGAVLEPLPARARARR